MLLCAGPYPLGKFLLLNKVKAAIRQNSPRINMGYKSAPCGKPTVLHLPLAGDIIYAASTGQCIMVQHGQRYPVTGSSTGTVCEDRYFCGNGHDILLTI